MVLVLWDESSTCDAAGAGSTVLRAAACKHTRNVNLHRNLILIFKDSSERSDVMTGCSGTAGDGTGQSVCGTVGGVLCSAGADCRSSSSSCTCRGSRSASGRGCERSACAVLAAVPELPGAIFNQNERAHFPSDVCKIKLWLGLVVASPPSHTDRWAFVAQYYGGYYTEDKQWVTGAPVAPAAAGGQGPPPGAPP